MILDAFSRKVVGWALSKKLKNRLTIVALERAITQRCPPAGLAANAPLEKAVRII